MTGAVGGPGVAALVHLVATLMMAGLIVFVQVVHYPLKATVDRASFRAYQAGHMSRTAWVVVPLMTAELATALWLVARPPSDPLLPVAVAGAGLLAVVWGSTALLQAPAHASLSRGFDARIHRRLVRTNWIRTAAWVLRVPVALLLAFPGGLP